MGRLRLESQCETNATSAASGLCLDQAGLAAKFPGDVSMLLNLWGRLCLPLRLESWRHDPDLCLIWAAFCTTSPLTLADGISLAKTRRPGQVTLDNSCLAFCSRSATEALKLLAGAETGKDHDGPVQQKRLSMQTISLSFRRSKPQSYWNQSGAFLWCSLLTRVFADRRQRVKVVGLRGFREAKDCWFQPISRQDEPRSAALKGLAKSIHSEARDGAEVWEGGRMPTFMASWKVHFSQSSAGITGVAKVVSKNIANKKKVDSEESVWLKNENIDIQSFEDIRSEIAVLTFLSTCAHCPYIISILGSFEDAFNIYLVTGYCEEGDLFERVAYGDPLAEIEKRRYISELLQGVRHLHQHNVGHRDISLENVLLRKGSCVLSDFGQAVQLAAQDGTVLRYFVEAGKSMYRSPEMHVPRASHVQVVCPADGRPGMRAVVPHETTRCEVLLPFNAVPGQPCTATPCGYAVAPADLFACGVCAFVLAIGKPPWATALDSDPSFSFIRRHGVANLLQQWKGGTRGPPGKSEEATLLAAMLRVDPVQRSTPDECLRNPWLEAVTRNRSKTA
ncbi:Camk2g [Symbiodinium sp. CCMP2592]|nr:Camk2g [Symbiodinium sp. CCMP2592]